MPFTHENLRVYQRALAFNMNVCAWIVQWDKIHAICDHLERAACSVIENIAMASASHAAMKVRSLEYALGSALECAACLDIAGAKRLITDNCMCVAKQELCDIFRMLFGLRKAWITPKMEVHEPDEPYGAKERAHFLHEDLDMYRVALDAVRIFSASEAILRCPRGIFRRLDELMTGVLLNIAEGNGRFSLAEKCRFIALAHEMTIKLAARLDIGLSHGVIPQADVEPIKALLERVCCMTSPAVGKRR